MQYHSIQLHSTKSLFSSKFRIGWENSNFSVKKHFTRIFFFRYRLLINKQSSSRGQLWWYYEKLLFAKDVVHIITHKTIKAIVPEYTNLGLLVDTNRTFRIVGAVLHATAHLKMKLVPTITRDYCDVFFAKYVLVHNNTRLM